MGLLLGLACLGTVYLDEPFTDSKTVERSWRKPRTKKGVELGQVRISSGNFFGDEKKQRGLETVDQKKYYLLYRNFTKRFDTRGKDLIVQYTVRMQSKMECGGHYIKLFSGATDMTQFNNKTHFDLMFGADVCGAKFRRTHFIIGHDGEQYATLKPMTCPKDHLTHAYQLVIRANGEFVVKVDGEEMDKATLEERFEIPRASTVPDEKSIKPADWDDEEWIVDPKDKKPASWDEEEFVQEGSQEHWDPNVQYVGPLKVNPNYKGKWKPRLTKNPNYKGAWQPKKVKREVEMDPTFGKFPQLAFLGLDVYQGHANSIFDNFFVTDNETLANEVLYDVFFSIQAAEVEGYDIVADRKRAGRAIEDARRDTDREHHHDHNQFSNSESDDDAKYFDDKRTLLRAKKGRVANDDGLDVLDL